MKTAPQNPTEPIGSGLVVIDKPQGWTSHDVVGRTRRLGESTITDDAEGKIEQKRIAAALTEDQIHAAVAAPGWGASSSPSTVCWRSRPRCVPSTRS